MKIDISAKEYRYLLDIIHVADAIMSGHRREQDQRSEQHRALIQKLYALASGEGLSQLISYNESMKRYFPTEDFEHNTLAHAVIDEFADHLFWDGLISRLTARDAALIAGGTERLSAMSDGDRQQVDGPIRQRYIAEFSLHGVANLEVIERFSAGAGAPVKTSD